MKISKRQLKRVIKEEKHKILREGVTHEDALILALDDYTLALQEQMPDAEFMDFLPDAIGFVEEYFKHVENENQYQAEKAQQQRGATTRFTKHRRR